MAAGADEIEERVENLERFRTDIERKFREAFPDGNHLGHCRYHDLMIETLEAKKRLRQAVMEKTVAGLVWGMLVGVTVACWEYIKSHSGR